MEIRFVRKQGERDRIYVRRGDGSTTSWTFPTYGDGLPHDLMHLVVESAFGLTDGFWARVDAGVDVARINADANRLGGADKYLGFGEDLRGLFVAEGLAGGPWSMAAIGDAELRDILASQCERMGIALPETVHLERIARVRAVQRALRERWQRLLPQGTLVLHVTPGDPDASFAALAASV